MSIDLIIILSLFGFIAFIIGVTLYYADKIKQPEKINTKLKAQKLFAESEVIRLKKEITDLKFKK